MPNFTKLYMESLQKFDRVRVKGNDQDYSVDRVIGEKAFISYVPRGKRKREVSIVNVEDLIRLPKLSGVFYLQHKHM